MCLEYPRATYTHQGWITNPIAKSPVTLFPKVAQRNCRQLILLNDGLGEVEVIVSNGVPIIHVIDLTNLRAPKWTGELQVDRPQGHRPQLARLGLKRHVPVQLRRGIVGYADLRSVGKYADVS